MTDKYDDEREIQAKLDLIAEKSHTPVSENVTPEDDESDDSILDKIFGTEEDAEEAQPTSVGSEEETSADVVNNRDEDSETNTEPNGLEGYDKAVSALQRDGVPHSVIDTLGSESPEMLIGWGLRRAKNQSDVDGYGAKLRELEDSKSGSSENIPGASDPTGEVQPEGQPLGQEDITRYQSEISEIFGEDAAKAIMTPMRATLQQTANMVQQQQDAIMQMAQESEERQILDSRTRLGERFPRLGSEQDFGTVIDQMQKLAQVGDYDNMDDLMTDAYRMKFAEDIAAAAVSKHRNTIRDAGQPTTNFQSSTPSGSKTTDEREDAVLDALLGGGGFDEATSAYNK